ncbi:hypothetical protein E4U37_008259 [Claviceps purpurea]|nr:hypothetical protein E4U37_008259 [Claviceps purpurea]
MAPKAPKAPKVRKIPKAPKSYARVPINAAQRMALRKHHAKLDWWTTEEEEEAWNSTVSVSEEDENS